MSEYSSSGSSYSTSTPTIPNYPQSAFLMQLAQYAAQLGADQYAWAASEYAKNSTLTDQAVQNYLAASKQAMDLAGNNYDRYTQLFQPLENQLIADANSYASPERKQFEMGAAETDTGQAMDQGRINAEKQLQSYGIDPSSGRYAELEQAQQAQKAAAQAGAGNTAARYVDQTARNLRSQAIQVGQQYPGQMVNAWNSALQGLTGAVNARLANANTGVNMFNSAVPFLNNAAGLKYPPLGNNSQSGSQNRSQGQGQGAPRTSGTQQGGGGGGGGAYDPSHLYGNAGYVNWLNPQYTGPDSSATDWGFGAFTPDYGYQYGYGGMDPNAYYNYSGSGIGVDLTDPNYYSYSTPSPWGPSGDTSGYTGWDSGGVTGPDSSSYGYDYSNYDTSSYDTGGGDYYDYGDYGGDYGYYARGGPVTPNKRQAMPTRGYAEGGAVDKPPPDENRGVYGEPDKQPLQGAEYLNEAVKSFKEAVNPWTSIKRGLGFGQKQRPNFADGGVYNDYNIGMETGGANGFDPASRQTNDFTQQHSPFTMAGQTSNSGWDGAWNRSPNQRLNPGMGHVGNGAWNHMRGSWNSEQINGSPPQNTPAQTFSTQAMPTYGGTSQGGWNIPMHFADGGDMPPDATTGGYVPQEASPSGGQEQDDVNANLNADEFVIPTDVSKWMGQKYFQDLINKSRKERAMTATAQGQPGKPNPGPATFVSQRMG